MHERAPHGALGLTARRAKSLVLRVMFIQKRSPISPRWPVRRSVAVALAALLSSGSAEPCARAGITDAVKTETLPNGLKVLVLENHKAPVATFNLFTKVGSRNESFGKTGISHLVEHLKFRGTKKYGPSSSPTSSRRTAGWITRSPAPISPTTSR